MKKLYQAGEIEAEMKEIERIQNKSDSFLTISTSTCGEFYTVICC